MKSVTINSANFDEVVAKSKVPVLVDFWAPWCGPCRMVAPIVEELAEDVAGRAVIGKVNVDEEMMIAQKYGIVSIPTIIVFENGSVKNKIVGFRDKADLRNLLGV